MIVHIPSALHSYTGRSTIEARGENLREILESLNRQFPGLRFRIVNEQGKIREHIRIFVNRNQVDSLDQTLNEEEEIHIITALSGG